MRRSPEEFLRDILESIEAIFDYSRKGRGHFEKTPMVRDATSARLMQIGQAVKDAQTAGAKLDQLAPSIRWRDIAGMRDRLAHKYWDIDHEIVWLVIENELPKLKAGVEKLLEPRPKSRKRQILLGGRKK